MPSWTCGLCETDDRWPTKAQAMDHVRGSHLDTLVRVSLERSEEDPNVDLPEDFAEAVDPALLRPKN